MFRVLAILALALQPALPYAGEVIAATDRFELRSDPRVNLHHFLIAWAAVEAQQWPPYALPVAERDYGLALTGEGDIRAWDAAVAAYAAANGRSVTFDAGLIALRDWAAGAAPPDRVPANDRPLAEALEAALPVYQRHWWPAHDKQNRAWAAAVTPLAVAVENDIASRLAGAFGGRWPEDPIPVDLVIYSNPVGAYSTGGRIVVSSADSGNRMPQALELLFHEASHVEPLEAPLVQAIEQAFDAAGRKAPERFWHDMIFFTAGDITRIVLANHGQPGYRHYGEFGVYRRGERWNEQLPLLQEHWRPFLESASAGEPALEPDRRAALRTIADRLQ